MKNKPVNFYYFLLIGIWSSSCSNQYLDVKPSSNLVVPHTLEDFQQLLDNGTLMFSHPEITEILADDYYFKENYWQSISNVVFKNSYIWADNIYGTVESDFYSWEEPYQQIFYANVVLDGLKNLEVTPQTENEYRHIMGSAYFIRAYALYDLSQLYAPAFDETNADQDLGLPIPLSSDVNERMVRSSVRETYDRMLTDLKESEKLLTNLVDYGRPSLAATWALLGRIYLCMRKYDDAQVYAEKCLDENHSLTDLNIKLVRDYKETLYLRFIAPATLIRTTGNNTLIDTNLYASYEVNDLRKNSLFKFNTAGEPIRNNDHNLGLYCFAGLDIDEQYLIRAECLARAGRIDLAMDDLNHLLRYMYKNYQDQFASTKEEALTIILRERRKQLVFRGLRWSDLKRYNKEGANISLTRKLGADIYTLGANSPKWLFPIPPNEIKISGIQQNIR